MKKPNLAKIKAMLGGKGLYIAAAACMAAVGGVGAATYNKAVKQINEGLGSTAPSITQSSKAELPAIEEKKDVPMDSSETESDSSEAAESSSLPDSSSQAEKKTVTQPNVMPVTGEVLNPFSFGELVKSKTLDVWRTHDGIDIKAEKGAAVKAMNHGEVSRIWEDPLWGSCISIDHGNGIESFYYSMSASMMVEEGDTVESGQVIGSVGDTAQVEAAEPSHLHFALKRANEWIDPVTFIDPYSNK